MSKLDLVTMSNTEVDRLEVMQRVAERRLTAVAAAEQLAITPRQVRRLLKAFRADGAAGLVSKKRGARSNRAYSEVFKERVVSIIQEEYLDFGPTLVGEKLSGRHEITLSEETLRRWMAEAGIWKHARRVASVSTNRDIAGIASGS